MLQKITLSAPEVAEYLGISRANAYNLMNAEVFPSFRIGKRILVTKDALDRWVEEKQNEKRIGVV